MGKVDLGQTFTRRDIADLMVSYFSLPEGSKVLDPCFGEGVFIKSLLDNTQYSVQGIEIDKNLFSQFQSSFPDLELYNDDYLSFDCQIPVDGIIMNPPYIRHEKFSDLASYGMTKEQIRSNLLYEFLPLTSNMYMYFVVKAIHDLRDGGELIAIFPSNWLQKRSDSVFFGYIQSFDYTVMKVVTTNGFERDALVETVIVKLTKTVKDVHNSSFVCDLDIFRDSVNLSSIAKIRRGITTGWNKFFILPRTNPDKLPAVPIISTPKQVHGYSTSDASFDLLLSLDEKLDIHSIDYVDEFSDLLDSEKDPKTLYNSMKSGKSWWIIKTFDCTGIIFGYIVRDSIRFVLNDNGFLVRDNFYIIHSEYQELLLSILNSSFVRYQLERAGKTYGNGILKLQRYDIDQIQIPDPVSMSDSDKAQLVLLSKRLIRTNDSACIPDIDAILANYSTYSLSCVEEKISELYNARMGDLDD